MLAWRPFSAARATPSAVRPLISGGRGRSVIHLMDDELIALIGMMVSAVFAGIELNFYWPARWRPGSNSDNPAATISAPAYTNIGR